MRVLVVGGAGYIGSHVAKALADSSITPIIYDNLSTGHKCLANGYELVVAHLADTEALRRSLENVTAVIHLAASCSVAESVVDPRTYFNNNVVNSLRLMDACLDSNVRYLIVSSSCAAYGVPEVNPISEQAPAVPVNPYGLSKLMIDQMLHDYSRVYDLKYIALRYFNAAGADEGCQLVEDHHPETHLIPAVLQVINGMRASVEVYGNNYPTPDGTCIRDFVHVSDLAEAHALALKYLMEDGRSGVINLGSGVGYSVMQVIRAVERVTQQKVPFVVKAPRPGDPPMLTADPSLAQSLLGWRARRTLDEMIQTAWMAMARQISQRQELSARC